MKTTSKNIFIHSTPEKVFAQMDNFSKTGMHTSESSIMMMGSKLKLEQLLDCGGPVLRTDGYSAAVETNHYVRAMLGFK